MLAFSPLRNAEEKKLAGSILDVVSSRFMDLTKRQREQLLVYLLHRWLLTDIHPEFNSSYIPRDFLPTAGNAMKVLFTNKKSNLIYDAASCFGEFRPNSPRMPLERMPFGLISHNYLTFFSSDNASNLKAPADYKSWYQSMYTLFSNKWAAMHNGPMWSYEDSDAVEARSSSAPQTGDSSTSDVLAQVMHQTFCSNSELLVSQALSSDAAEAPSFSAPQTVDSSTASDVFSEALHQTFGSNSELLVSNEITPVLSSATNLETPYQSEPNEENVPVGH